MAGKMKAWAKSLPSETKQSMWGRLSDAGMNEARFARDDIRQKLIEEGWAGKPQTERARFYEADTSEAKPNQTDVAEETAFTIQTEDFGSTVWEQESRNGIEPMDSAAPAPNLPNQRPDIEPE